MSIISFKKVEIKGVSAVVPKNVVDNRKFTDIFSIKELENAIRTTGISERRFASKDTCSSDLCYEAAKNLINDLNIDLGNIDLIIFLSQTPDYHQPATAPILQHKLGLKKECAAFDINLACSGYIYGLSTAFAYASQDGINNVLLLVGETLSKIISNKDKATSLLFGDGGTATLIGKAKEKDVSYFSLNSDGSGESVLKIKAGGYRYPSNSDTIVNKIHKDGNVRNDEQLFMDGMEVFNFTMREVPKDIKHLLSYVDLKIEDVDYIFFHQANKFMTDFFAKKLNYPIEKVPYSIQKYGNTSAVSVPLTIVSEMNNKKLANKRILLSGYGGGLSWGTALLCIKDIHISTIKEI